MNALSALDVLRMKTDKAPLENAVVLFADYELEARQDGRNIIASLAAAELAAKDAELAALRQERDDWKQRAEQRAEAIQYAIEYLKETHPERVKYPEYIEFHVCNSLAIAIMPERVDGEK